jgi:pyrroline-5-carboxylate reductase
MKLAFIGGGVMGEAMIRGILSKGLAAPGDIVADDISAERRKSLAQGYDIAVTGDHNIAVKGADVIVLAVKPQNLPDLTPELRSKLTGSQLILSIIAGARIATIKDGVGHELVVRAMPNTPAQIGEGVTVWTASGEVGPSQREMARSILGALGREIYVADESYIDMATAVSGSGPGYIFLIIEALIDAAVGLGLSPNMARELVLETVVGAGRLAQATGKEPAELRDMVTSPGGTTAAGLLKLEEGGLRELLDRAVIAAYERAKTLGVG